MEDWKPCIWRDLQADFTAARYCQSALEPAEVIRKLFDHFNAEEDQQYLALFDPGVVIHTPKVPAQLGERRETFEGRPGVAHLLQVLRERARRVHAEVERIVPLDRETVLVLATMWVDVEGASSGTRVGMEYRVADDRVIRVKTYATRDEALRAAGLPSEHELA